MYLFVWRSSWLDVYWLSASQIIARKVVSFGAEHRTKILKQGNPNKQRSERSSNTNTGVLNSFQQTQDLQKRESPQGFKQELGIWI